LKPDTSSDSPSAKSNGVRFVSATEDTKITNNTGKNNNIFNHRVFILERIIILNLIDKNKKNNKAKANITS
jgi:hypothetical protein